MKNRLQPADQAKRDRFVTELERNFSVIAPAGVGKTKAIVDRVVAIATGDALRAREWLPRLVVVTYTKKAADEMHQRARNAIIERKVDLTILSQFNRAFFGTIHSFCVRLLRSHGHLLGLPGKVEALENDDDLWAAFLRQMGAIAPGFPTAGKAACLRFQSLEDVLSLAREVRRDHMSATLPPLGPCPVPRTDTVLNYQAKGSSKATIERAKESVRSWLAGCATDAPYVPLPENSSKSDDFVELWSSAFGPLHDWIKRASWQMAVEVAADYRNFRQTQGQLTYDDQIDLAYDLVRDPRAGRQLREEEYRVILDEAQDTDPAQFAILLELARPVEAQGLWLETGGVPPAPGRFCMVGDPQQSIYGSRADLAHYAAVRERLLRDGSAEETSFDVTFRCDEAIIDAVNRLAAPMLHGEDGQAAFYPLQARPDAGPGQVVRLELPDLPDTGDEKPGVDQIALHEARVLATWIQAEGLAKFGAHTWSDVALLCPRRRWIDPIEQALREVGLIPQIHSDRSIRGDSPAYAWFTALCTVMADPRNGFELAGVLRELFGISDDAMARFTCGDGSKLQIVQLTELGGEVGTALQALARLRARLVQLPLRDAMHEMERETLLRRRLRAIGEDSAAVDAEIDGLLALASVAEANGSTMAAFAEMLRDNFDAELPGRPVQMDAIQLITCHKAKGLQWEAVILPMMFRGISTVPDYPKILQGGPGRPPRVLFSKADIGDLGEVLDRKSRQELQRLLYVAMTRPKKTLVLVDDRNLFPRKKPNNSFADLAELMQLDGSVVYNKFWEDLPQALHAPVRGEKKAQEYRTVEFPLLSSEVFMAAGRASASGPTRVLPYALAEKVHADQDAVRDDEQPTAGAEAARHYGIWWHGFMESIDWRRVDARVVAASLGACPQPERGAREWSMLQKSGVIDLLSAPGQVVHKEMPFLHPRDVAHWTEGIMDLAIFRPMPAKWLVLDWKTNLIAAERVQDLRALYAPQLGAYAAALHAITGVAVETMIYSTACGTLLEC